MTPGGFRRTLPRLSDLKLIRSNFFCVNSARLDRIGKSDTLPDMVIRHKSVWTKMKIRACIICELHVIKQTAALERQPDRRASLRQNGTGGGRVFAGWRALNRLRTRVGRANTVMRRWGYLDDAQTVNSDCGEPHTMTHLLSCHLLDEACTADDLATMTERAKACARKWETIV